MAFQHMLTIHFVHESYLKLYQLWQLYINFVFHQDLRHQRNCQTPRAVEATNIAETSSIIQIFCLDARPIQDPFGPRFAFEIFRKYFKNQTALVGAHVMHFLDGPLILLQQTTDAKLRFS